MYGIVIPKCVPGDLIYFRITKPSVKQTYTWFEIFQLFKLKIQYLTHFEHM